MATASYVVPSLLQGISHQATEQRRVGNVEDQQNVFNSVKDGAVARMPLQFVAKVSGKDFTNAAFNEVFRGGVTEHYLQVFNDGAVSIYDLSDGTACTITIPDAGANSYLVTSPDAARDNFRFQVVNDYTFLANRKTTIAMTSDLSEVRPPEALIFIKAGGYSLDYSVGITFGGFIYTWSYTTPDNSVSSNGAYIATAQIAATLFRAMSGTAAPVPTSGDAAPTDYNGVQATYAGSTGTVGSITAASLGFSMDIRGNVIRVWRTDTQDFLIDTADSVGDTYMDAIKDTVASIDKLPQKGFVGFRIQVSSPDVNDTAEDFYLTYTDQDIWAESIGPAEHTKLDTTTMPHALINTGFRAFEYVANTWSTRLVGDSDSAPLPYFVGETIEDLSFFNSRLAVLTAPAVDFGKTRNVFDFFPDTVQTTLATQPIDIPVQGAKSISLGRRLVLVDESCFIWCQEAQFRLDSGAQPFQADQINNKPNSAYAFSEVCAPLVNGSELHFAVDPGDFVSIQTLAYSGGRSAPSTDLTEHVPDLIPTGVRNITTNSTSAVFFVQTDGDPTALYCYNTKVQGSEIVQSAWNRWVLPCDKVLWASITNNILYLGMQRKTGSDSPEFIIATANLLLSSVDPGVGNTYRTRLDFMLSETQVSMSYDPVANMTTITPPLDLGAELTAGDLKVCIRTDTTGFIRGRILDVAADYKVAGDLRDAQFYMGVLIDTWTVLSEFFPRNTSTLSSTQAQAALYEFTTVREVLITHYNTVTYDVIKTDERGTTTTTSYNSRTAGSVPTSTLGAPTPSKGYRRVPVMARSDLHTLTLQNKSPYPSAWQRLKYIYEYINRGEANSGV